ncbi:hypothetical protein VI817_006658 [Penicillium citrinum]|nr:hypothetical protein VI817_006658 [Penicillium citrinum]
MTAESLGNRRSACDRCRRHKLRCERGDAVRCRRCEKADVECIMGPALRSGRPHQLDHTINHGMRYTNIHQVPPDVHRADESTLHLATPSGFTSSESDVAFPRIFSPTNLEDFGHFWIQSFDPGSSVAQLPNATPIAPVSESRKDCLKKLSDLQAGIVVDIETVKGCITADKCPEAINSSDSNPITGQNRMIGRVLDYSTSLIEILNEFQPPTGSEPFELTCDMPTMFVLLSCYVGLVRIYRTLLSCVLDCLPVLLGIEQPVPQLFPGMQLGGFKLEARLDLQVQILVQISEDMLRTIESRFGLLGHIFQPPSDTLSNGKAARILSSMLEEEANEQPPLYQPRGYCDPLKIILGRLKGSV